MAPALFAALGLIFALDAAAIALLAAASRQADRVSSPLTRDAALIGTCAGLCLLAAAVIA